MNWKNILFKLNYFVSTQERLKSTLISLVILVAIGIMMFDVYGSILNSYFTMAIIESLLIVLLIFLYLLFPKYISLNKTIYIVLSFLTLFIVISLTIPGYNHEFALFALAIVPAYIFSLLGIKKGIQWSIVIIVMVALSTLNAYMSWISPVFTTELLLQVSIAYVILSFFHYIIEKERNQYELSLATALKEKEVLLKEVHHRAKNNLQTIMGLLESQAMRTEHSECKKLLTSQRTRLQSMSLLHENLAIESSYEKVNMRQYLNQIIHNIQKGTQHTLSVDIESFMLEMSEAVNVGLFVNEAVSNAIQHAYPKNESGVINVSLECHNEMCTLSIQDFGKGFNSSKTHNSLGLILMEDISSFLKNGSMMIDFDTGVKIIVTFSIEAS